MSTTKKILIVDDEFLILYSLSKTLPGDDREVKTASNGRDALKELGDHHYDLCLLDIHLPDMNGLDIMKTLRKASPATKIIIMTGSEVTDAMMKSIQENAHLLISKPFDLDQIKAFTDQMLAQAGTPPLSESNALQDHEPFIQQFIKWTANENQKREPGAIAVPTPALVH